jgi:hypothetical protein
MTRIPLVQGEFFSSKQTIFLKAHHHLEVSITILDYLHSSCFHKPINMSNNLLTFGIEMELLLKPKVEKMSLLVNHGFNTRVKPQSTDRDQKNKNRRALRDTLAFVLTRSRVRTGTSTGDYSDWSVIDESCLDEVQEFCGFTSPPNYMQIQVQCLQLMHIPYTRAMRGCLQSFGLRSRLEGRDRQSIHSHPRQLRD